MKYNLVENSRTMAEDSNTGHAASVGDAKEQIVDDQDLSTPSVNPNDPTKEVKMPTKVVVRRLPSSMKEKDFLESVSPLPDYDHLVFSEADQTLIPHGLTSATINFVNEEDVYPFKERFDGYVFVDKKGHEYPAIVEFAPNQKIPKKSRSRKDAKSGTIDQDPDFIKFLEVLDNPTKSTRTIQQCLEDIDAKEKEQKSKEKSTPLLDYIKEKADKKRQDREQRRESRKKREDDRKKAREDERKRRKEKKEQELREKEMRDRDKKEKTLGKSGSVRQQHKSFEPDKNRTEKYERSSKYHRDELSHEPTETSGRRGSRGGKGSRYQNDEIKYPSSKNERSINSSSSNRGTSKPERDRVEKEKPVSTVKGNNDANVEQEDCNKSESKYSSKSSSSRSKDDRRTKEEPKEERATKSREARQNERNERELQIFRKREQEKQRKWQVHKEERQRQKEDAVADLDSPEASNNICDIKTNVEDNALTELKQNSISHKGVESEAIVKMNSSSEISQSASSKSSKRYNGRRSQDKVRKEVPDRKHSNGNDAITNTSLVQMSKDLSNILHLERDGVGVDQEVQLNDKQPKRRDINKVIPITGNNQRVSETRELERDKSKIMERPALQIYRPGMGRLNSQANTKGGNTKYDEDERYKVSETDNTKYADNDKHFKPDKFANKQKDRNNRSYKTDPINDKPEYKRYNDRYARQNYRAEASDYDQDRRASVHEKEYKEHSKPLTKTEENRKRSDWKFDHKNKSKDEQDGARNNDAEKPSAKYEEKQGTSGKDRKELGRNYNKPLTPNQQSSKTCEALPITGGNKDQKESMGTTETASPIGPTKEKERSGKSYSSKRRERQQQRNEQ